MSITLYSGTPGSYKSYHATQLIVTWLGRNKNVICNYPVNARKYYGDKKKLGNFILKDNITLTVDFLVDYAKNNHDTTKYKAQTLVVIDEASIMFNSRDYARANRMKWIKFFATHRHYGFDFILICQNDRMIDTQIRSLIEFEIKHMNIESRTLLHLIVGKLFHGLFQAVEYYHPTRTQNSVKLCRFQKKYAVCYDTTMLFDNQLDDSNEIQKKIDDDAKRKKDMLLQQQKTLAIINFLKSQQALQHEGDNNVS